MKELFTVLAALVLTGHALASDVSRDVVQTSIKISQDDPSAAILHDYIRLKCTERDVEPLLNAMKGEGYEMSLESTTFIVTGWKTARIQLKSKTYQAIAHVQFRGPQEGLLEKVRCYFSVNGLSEPTRK